MKLLEKFKKSNTDIGDKKNKSALREWIETIITSGILAAFIIIFVVQSFVVQGQSMEPTLHNGERLFVNKFIYRFTEPKRGDIIVLTPKGAPKTKYIKRVIGLPGDTVTIENKQVRVNGEVLKEDYVDVLVGENYGTYKVPEGHVFVLGDNRHFRASSDSRFAQPVGYVDYDSISGKAAVVYWPVTRIRLLSNPEYENIRE